MESLSPARLNFVHQPSRCAGPNSNDNLQFNDNTYTYITSPMLLNGNNASMNPYHPSNTLHHQNHQATPQMSTNTFHHQHHHHQHQQQYNYNNNNQLFEHNNALINNELRNSDSRVIINQNNAKANLVSSNLSASTQKTSSTNLATYFEAASSPSSNIYNNSDIYGDLINSANGAAILDGTTTSRSTRNNTHQQSSIFAIDNLKQQQHHQQSHFFINGLNLNQAAHTFKPPTLISSTNKASSSNNNSYLHNHLHNHHHINQNSLWNALKPMIETGKRFLIRYKRLIRGIVCMLIVAISLMMLIRHLVSSSLPASNRSGSASQIAIQIPSTISTSATHNNPNQSGNQQLNQLNMGQNLNEIILSQSQLNLMKQQANNFDLNIDSTPVLTPAINSLNNRFIVPIQSTNNNDNTDINYQYSSMPSISSFDTMIEQQQFNNNRDTQMQQAGQLETSTSQPSIYNNNNNNNNGDLPQSALLDETFAWSEWSPWSSCVDKSGLCDASRLHSRLRKCISQLTGLPTDSSKCKHAYDLQDKDFEVTDCSSTCANQQQQQQHQLYSNHNHQQQLQLHHHSLIGHHNHHHSAGASVASASSAASSSPISQIAIASAQQAERQSGGHDTECLQDEWRCHDTQCIPLSKRCDGHSNCYDSSDERDCPLA